MSSHFVNEIILLVVSAFVGGYVARSIKLPPVVGYLTSGVIVGVLGRNFIPSFEGIFELSQIGVSLLLFTLGFEVSLNYLAKINKKVLTAGIMQIILTSVVLFPFLIIFRIPIETAILFSLLFSFSSTAVVLKLLEEKGMINNFPGTNVFVILLMQDLFIIPVIFLIPLIFNQGGALPESTAEFLLTTIKPIGVLLGLYIVNKLFLKRLFRLFFKYPSQELTVLATIFLAVASIGILMYAGLPETISAFFAGVLISENRKNLAPLASIRPLRDVLLVLFFVMVGMLVDGSHLIYNLPFILGLTTIILLVKFFVVFVVLRALKFLPASNIFIASHIANVGEFAVIIGQIAFIEKFITRNTYEDLLSIFIISLILIPIIVKISQVVFGRYKNTPFVKKMMGESNYFSNPTLKGMKDHVIICGHGRVGKEVRKILDMAAVPYIVIDYNKTIVDDLEKDMKNALYGDPSDPSALKMASIKDAKILVAAVPDGVTQMVLVKNALQLNPNIVILCRSHVDEDKYELVNLGVNTIIIPEFEAGLRMGKKVLELLNFNDEKTHEFLKKLRKFHLVR